MQRLAGTSVLVVEDDPETLALYVARLEQLGATVTGTCDAVSALAILATGRPDVVLCDLHLPELDGYQLLERMRESPELVDVPVIAISGSHPALEADRCKRAGFAEHLTKPVRFSVVVESIESAAGQGNY